MNPFDSIKKKYEVLQNGGAKKYEIPQESVELSPVQVLQSTPHARIPKGTKLRIVLEGDELVLISTGLLVDECVVFRGSTGGIIASRSFIPRPQFRGTGGISSFDVRSAKARHGDADGATIAAAEHIARQNEPPDMQMVLNIRYIDLVNKEEGYAIVVAPTFTGGFTFESTVERLEDISTSNKRRFEKLALDKAVGRKEELRGLLGQSKNVGDRMKKTAERISSLESRISKSTKTAVAYAITETEKLTRKMLSGEITEEQLKAAKQIIFNKAVESVLGSKRSGE